LIVNAALRGIQSDRTFEIIPVFLMNWIAVTFGYGTSGMLIFGNLKSIDERSGRCTQIRNPKSEIRNQESQPGSMFAPLFVSNLVLRI